MASEKITITWQESGNTGGLKVEDRALVEAAKEAASRAYAPYSGFMVGAALRLDNGEIVLGTNVENAAFPSGICAERNAISAAVAAWPSRKPVALAIAARNSAGFTREPVTPCGNCRQVIAEEEYRNGSPIRLILYGSKKVIFIGRGSDLLPLQFNRDSLGANLP